MASPIYKVYTPDNTYQGCCKEPEAAVALAQWYGVGSTVRYQHRHEVWRVSEDNQDSYDEAALAIEENIKSLKVARGQKVVREIANNLGAMTVPGIGSIIFKSEA